MTECALCHRNDVTLTKHHALPKEEGGKENDIILICTDCHRQIHALYTNKELAIRLNTVQTLLEDEQLKRFFKFIRKQPNSKKVRVKKSNDIFRKK
ncbi:MAG TPA: hypothetical protein DCY20_00705 [Firmicutes bacterium]|nr:hypothetical protein [Bacillota bacterium]